MIFLQELSVNLFKGLIVTTQLDTQIGGAIFGVLGNYTNRWGRDPVVLLGMLTHLLSFLLIFYNLPDAAIHGNVTNAYGQLFKPSRYIHTCIHASFHMCALDCYIQYSHVIIWPITHCSCYPQITLLLHGTALCACRVKYQVTTPGSDNV